MRRRAVPGTLLALVVAAMRPQGTLGRVWRIFAGHALAKPAEVRARLPLAPAGPVRG